MTREEVRKAAGVMIAYANGEEIEYKPRCGNGQWIRYTASYFNWITNEYRIKPKEKFDPKALKPFDKVLIRDTKLQKWSCDLFSYIGNEEGYYPYICVNNAYKMIIPYNDDTKHLLGTTEEAPEYYRYWEK